MNNSFKSKKRTTSGRYFYDRDRFWLIVIIIFSAVYIFFAFINKATRDFSFDSIRNRLTTLFAIISAIAFWLQFKKTERLNESNYVKDLNNQFVNNKNMTKIEHELELYFNQYTEIKKQLKRAKKEDVSLTVDYISQIHLGINLSRTDLDCQQLIDYLVYLESLAVMVENGVIRIRDVDDLFSYRFFLAVNNPVVQEQELLPYSDYYRGTYNLSQRWMKLHRKKNIPIPMEEFCLSFDRLNEWEKVNKCSISAEKVKPAEYKKLPVDCSFAKSIDNKNEIALCLYETDPFIYPEAFGDDKESAIKAISSIIGMDESLFDYNNLFLARYNGQVCGVVCIYTGDSNWDKQKIKERIGTKYLSAEAREEGFDNASALYFDQYNKKDFSQNTVELVAVCVEKGFRNRGFALKMLRALLNEKICEGKQIRLTVLKDNLEAIEVYKKLGFTFTGEEKEGFGSKGYNPKTIEMVRDNSINLNESFDSETERFTIDNLVHFAK